MNFNSTDFVLGKNITNYESLYNPALLARHPRSLNRKTYEIEDENLPFVGYDMWHAYEETFLLTNGQPVTFMMKIKVPASSKYIVESKSLKLYLYSFAMQRFPGTEEEATKRFIETVEEDLSTLLECSIKVAVFRSEDYLPVEDSFLKDAKELSTTCSYGDLNFIASGEDPTLLKEGNFHKSFFIKSDMLRSRCLITKQPDTGTIFIYMKGSKLPTYESLATYIYSLREEHHFHEEIVEAFYKRLFDLFTPIDLMVTALYNRRGGIDICPCRSSSSNLLPPILGSVDKLTTKEYRQ